MAVANVFLQKAEPSSVKGTGQDLFGLDSTASVVLIRRFSSAQKVISCCSSFVNLATELLNVEPDFMHFVLPSDV